jgi:CBS domain-containing protein
MLVREVMNRDVVTTEPDASLREAAKKMNQHHIGSLVVVEEEEIVGILTERNILIAIAEGKNPEGAQVKDIMKKKVVTIEPDKMVEDAVELMTKNRIKKLPVVENGKLVGIITCSDIAVVEPKLIEAIANLVSIKLPGFRGG